MSLHIDRNNLFLLERNYKALLREIYPIAQIDELTVFFASRGLFVEVSDTLVDSNGRRNGALNSRVVYVSKNRKVAVLGKSVDFSIDPTKVAVLWKLLGYPPCCIDFFIRSGNLSNFELLSILANTSDVCDKRLNILDKLSIYHIPCSFWCGESIRRAELLNRDDRSGGRYVVFPSMLWIKLDGWSYSFWSYFRSPSVGDPDFLRVKTALIQKEASILFDGDRVCLSFVSGKQEILTDVLLLHFS